MWGWGVCVKPSAAKEFLLWPLEEFLKLKWCNTQQQDRQVWGTCAIKFKSQDTPQKVKVTLKSINHFFVFPFGKTCKMRQHCTGINHNNPTYAGGSRGWWHVFLQYRFSGCVSTNSMGTWKSHGGRERWGCLRRPTHAGITSLDLPFTSWRFGMERVRLPWHHLALWPSQLKQDFKRRRRK